MLLLAGWGGVGAASLPLESVGNSKMCVLGKIELVTMSVACLGTGKLF